MYIEYFVYCANNNLQGSVSRWEAFQVEFNGNKTARIILHDNNDDSDLCESNLDKKHIAIELSKEDAIKIAKGILFAFEVNDRE